LVLVAAAMRIFTGWLTHRAVRYDLLGVSARDDYGAGPFVTHGAAPADLQR
jgi:hypothetical protein